MTQWSGEGTRSTDKSMHEGVMTFACLYALVYDLIVYMQYGVYRKYSKGPVFSPPTAIPFKRHPAG
jgi:hypothetical protein